MGAPNTGTIKQVATELAAEMGSTKFVDNLGDLLGAIRSETIKLHERRIPRLNFLLESLNGIVGNFHIIEIVYRNCTFWRKHQASVRLAAQLPAIARCQYAQVLSMNLVVPNRSSSAARFTMTLHRLGRKRLILTSLYLFPHARIETKGYRLLKANSLEISVRRIEKVVVLYGNYCRRHG